MDDNNIAIEILASYKEITVDVCRSNERYVHFDLFGHQFVLLCPGLEDSTSKAIILVSSESQFDFPHIMMREITNNDLPFLPFGKYRYICLHEEGSVVFSLQTYEEKIIDEVEQLIKLMSLSPIEVEKEYQKEFLYYWNQVANETDIELYLGNIHVFSKLNVYNKEKTFRYLSDDVNLTDIDKRNKKDRIWQNRADISAFFIPIIDSRGILPPTKDHKWGITEIKEVLCGKRIGHISHESYEQLKGQTVKYNIIDLVFSMDCNSLPVTFSARITCKNSKEKPLLQKVLEDCVSVQELYSKRQDYYYLNKCIGNQCFADRKKVLLVGVGSLGSYVANELVKNGLNQITIYDGDVLHPENFMRWAYGGILKHHNKADAIKTLLEFVHPEIHILSNAKNLDESELVDQANQYDYIIFTVGSSDVQLNMNRALKKCGCKAHTIFAWLEAGGLDSHILSVSYDKPGCFECLFTTPEGRMTNNKANKHSDDVDDNILIRNGCGGTRAPYGTAVLLRTVSSLLELINKIDNHMLEKNCLIDITPDRVTYTVDAFVEKECRCCGNKT